GTRPQLEQRIGAGISHEGVVRKNGLVLVAQSSFATRSDDEVFFMRSTDRLGRCELRLGGLIDVFPDPRQICLGFAEEAGVAPHNVGNMSECLGFGVRSVEKMVLPKD